MRESKLPVFELRVIPEGERDYRLAIWQRSVVGNGNGTVEERIQPLATIAGPALHLALDQVLDALKREGHRANVLRPAEGTFQLGEETGVRLGLLFLALKPLRKVSRMEGIAAGVRAMPAEETYYWFSKCATPRLARRAQHALRILLAGE